MSQPSPVTLRRYDLPSAGNDGWAIFVIGSDGYFSAVSDFGAFGYYWKYHGMDDFRQFLIKAKESPDYFIEKLSPGEEYDPEGTHKALERELETLLQELPEEYKTPLGHKVRDLAQEALDGLSVFPTEIELHDWAGNHAYIFWEYLWECGRRRHPWMVQRFVREALARLAEVLEKEMAGEAEGIAEACSIDPGLVDRVQVALDREAGK